MPDRGTLTMLAAHPFLQGMSEAHLQTLAECARRVTATAGQLLGEEKEGANAFFLIQSGQVAIEAHTPDRGTVRIQLIGPGDVVGWSWLVPPHRWQFDARVVEMVQAIALDAASIRTRCEQDHDLGYQLFKRLVSVISARLAATCRQLLDTHR